MIYLYKEMIMFAISQAEHAAINAREYPGTRQVCVVCAQPTGRCEEDAIYDSLGNGPLCPECLDLHPETERADERCVTRNELASSAVIDFI